MNYLKIENIGICPSECFTVLGVSLADTSSNSVIGQFGSGCKHGIAVCLRNDLAPVVFSGKLKMEFGTRSQKVKDDLASKDVRRIVVKYGGKDQDGTNRSSTEDLGFVLDYGKMDWHGVDLALREFVSNAIDRSCRERGDWSGVTIEIVQENQVRAKDGYTRIFVPMNTEVFDFYNNLGKWFLHFSEPESMKLNILPKANRNIGERRSAVIYRRGVRVREFESSDVESLFDYNLDNLRLDESRQASDWDVQHYCSQAFAAANEQILATYFRHVLSLGDKVWEDGFSRNSLSPNSCESNEETQRKREVWTSAFNAICGSRAVIVTDTENTERLEKKGFMPVKAPAGLAAVAQTYGLATADTVLTADERLGREVSEPTADVLFAVDLIWDTITALGLTNGKEKPEARVFSDIMSAGAQTLGFHRIGTNMVFINRDISVGQSPQLIQTTLEEIAHYVTGSLDFTRDFQDYAFNVAAKLMMR